MDKPDFSQYSQIDESRPSGPPELAGFWRRTGAFVLDVVVIGIVGFCLGQLFYEQFEAMGSWGRLVGFLVSLAYFGIMESPLFQGATLGKRVMRIKVEAADGAPLGPGKALLRAAVFSTPYFLNGAGSGRLNDSFSGYALAIVLTLLTLGLGATIIYLCLFNRRTRQSVHDLIVGAVVVRAGREGAPSLMPVWRGHFAILAALAAVVIGIGGIIYSKVGKNVQPLNASLKQINALSDVRDAGMWHNITYSVKQGDRQFQSIAIKAVTRGAVADPWALSKRIATIAFNSYPDTQHVDGLSVTLMHGYDIGIASNWSSTSYNGTPLQWSQSLAGQ